MKVNCDKNNIKSHRDVRREYKKNRRKLKRQHAAQIRDAQIKIEEKAKLKNPTYLTWLAEQRALELMREEQLEFEQEENNRKWLEREKVAQQEFREQQEKLLQIEIDKAKERIRIQLGHEREQKRIEEIRLKRILLADERRKRHELLMEKIDAYINDNAVMPEELLETAETNPGKELCPFFIKTSSCRFGDRCSRNHVRPGVSKLLLAPNFFNHILLEQNKSTEYGCDTYLEYDNSELYKEFNDFFEDVTSELEKFGKLQHFLVSSNYEPHLRGNVFIEYFEQRDAMKAYRSLRSRFYAGKRINVEFSTINSWNAAICGLSFSKKCPKGKTCNFLHPFKNPASKYIVQYRRNGSVRLNSSGTSFHSGVGSIRVENIPMMPRINLKQLVQRTWNDDAQTTDKRNWRWSESPEHDIVNTDRPPSRKIDTSPTYYSTRKSRSPSTTRQNSNENSINRYASRKRSSSRSDINESKRRVQNSPRERSRSRSSSKQTLKDGRSSSSRASHSSYRKKSNSRERSPSQRSDRKISRRSRNRSSSRSREKSIKRRKSSKKRSRSRNSESSSSSHKKAKKHKKSKKHDRKK